MGHRQIENTSSHQLNVALSLLQSAFFATNFSLKKRDPNLELFWLENESVITRGHENFLGTFLVIITKFPSPEVLICILSSFKYQSLRGSVDKGTAPVSSRSMDRDPWVDIEGSYARLWSEPYFLRQISGFFFQKNKLATRSVWKGLWIFVMKKIQ